MLGWEFAPIFAGGVGVVCAALTKALLDQGVDILFVLPKNPKKLKIPHLVTAEEVLGGELVRRVPGRITPYPGFAPAGRVRLAAEGQLYGSELFAEIERYAEAVRQLALTEHFDIVHAHDWPTFKAGIAAKELSKKPLIVHVHSTEHDRTGGHGGHRYVKSLEHAGVHAADKVVAVSDYTRRIIAWHYHVPFEKIEVVHNAADYEHGSGIVTVRGNGQGMDEGCKTVLYVGRLTLQKGPDWFIEIARKVLEAEPNTRFVIAGSGDMETRLIERAAELGIGHKVLFAGFLESDDITRAYEAADVFVMPSVSEPFGIVALEAIRHGTPAVISKQSGVSEVLRHALRADFWDVHEMANKITATLRYPALRHEIVEHASAEIAGLRWSRAAERCAAIYRSLTALAG